MKRILTLCAASAILLFGCGKSADQKKLESDLENEIQKAHHNQMTLMEVLDSLSSAIDVTLARHDSLTTAFPRELAGHTSESLKAAQASIASAQTAMNEWMKTYHPYDETTSHEEAMKKLNKDMQDLMAIQSRIDSAMKEASQAITEHTRVAEEYVAKLRKTRK